MQWTDGALLSGKARDLCEVFTIRRQPFGDLNRNFNLKLRIARTARRNFSIILKRDVPVNGT